MKRKINLSLLLITVIVLSIGVGAFAEANLQKISVYLNKGVHLKLNGKDWEAKDQSGNRQFPITYEGSTYLPVRSIGEALNVKIDWDGEANTVWIGNSPGATIQQATSRTNPAKLGDRVHFVVENTTDHYEGSATINKVVRGEQAWKLIQEQNRYNNEPDEGYEYLLVEFNIEINKSYRDQQVWINSHHFVAISSDGKEYEYASVVIPEPEIDSRLYAGEYHVGWAAFMVKVGDTPTISFAKKEDGTGGSWFSTQSR